MKKLKLLSVRKDSMKGVLFVGIYHPVLKNIGNRIIKTGYPPVLIFLIFVFCHDFENVVVTS